uniref:Uncharacterized protein n=1 Tax=Anguilla anguilla TaxID=7936 RepID=A0A0E9SYK8_ANGAN
MQWNRILLANTTFTWRRGKLGSSLKVAVLVLRRKTPVVGSCTPL